MGAPMTTVAIIPALNEHKQLQGVIEQARRHVDQVIVIDDGSRQPLSEHLPSWPNVTVRRHAINLGKGAAMKTGVTWARHHGIDAAVFIDADGQHDPNEIPQLLQPLISNSADIVFGVRQFHGRMPLVARIGNIVLTKALQWLYQVQVEDTQSGFRALRLSVWDQIAWRSPRYAVETEMIVNTGKHHVRYAQVPITTIYLDKYKGTTVIDGIRIMINMLAWKIL